MTMSSADKYLAVLRQMKIKDQRTAKTIPWSIYPQQELLLRAICDHDKVIVLKSRQIGSSTLCLAYAALYGIKTAGATIAIVAHNAATSKKLQSELRQFLSQCGKRLRTDSQYLLELNNGTKYVTLTAGSKTAGRGYTFSLIVASECAYYENSQDVMAALLATTTNNAKVIIESTAAAGDNYYRSIWDGENEYKKVFSPFSQHPNYKTMRDVTEDDIALPRSHGIQNVESATWWMDKYRDLGSDEIRMLREYPEHPHQAFSASQGRWIPTDTEVLPYHTDHVYPIKIFQSPSADMKYYVGVDVAAGHGGDDSAIVVYGSDERIHATYAANTVKIDEYAHVIQRVVDLYEPKMVIVEKNGLGEGLSAILNQAGVLHIPHTTTATTAYTGMLWVRNQIVAGLAACETLRDNCQSCQIETNSSGKTKYTGRKDMLMALSLLGCHIAAIRQTNTIQPPRVIPEGHYDGLAAVNRAIKNNARAKWL
jgi:hypothetical protein